MTAARKGLPSEADAAERVALAQERLGVTFTDPGLLRKALTHSSYSFEAGTHGQYERLEFLGDSVLGLAMAEHLYRTFPDAPEGNLAKLRAALVSGSSLAHVAGELRLGDCVLMGHGADVTGARRLASVLADVFEAVVGAVFLDGGWETARAFVPRVFGERITPEALADAVHDPKSELQERTMADSGLTPEYVIVAAEGPPHERVFTAEVLLDGKVLGRGGGHSKKDAEKAAAEEALRVLDAPRRPRRHR
jgi:ribonuclease-3